MPVLDWIKKNRDKVKYHDARRHNTQEENEILDLAQHRWHVASSEKTDHEGKDLHKKWKDLDKMYRGRQWQQQAPAHKSQPVLNFTFSLVESVVPRITDNRPEVLVLPRESPEDKGLADKLAVIHPYIWDINKMHSKMPELVRHALKYGTSIIKIHWDPDFHGEVGDIKYSVVHPMNFFPDPRSYTIQDMDYCFVRSPKSMEYFHRRWPEKGRYVVPDTDWTDTEEIASSFSTQEETATLTEYYFRDENGDMCCMFYSGHIVLDIVGGKYDEQDEPLYRHNRFPFAKMLDYPADKEFWGISEVELVEILQRLINNFEAQIIDNTRLMANAQWVVNKVASGIKEEDAWIFDNDPGETIFTHNGGVERLDGSPIPPHIPEHMERLIHAMEQILGIHDVVQGRAPSGVRAASAIIALQESANIRVRQKNKQLEETLKEVAEQTNWLVLEHYEDERNMRLTGQEVPTTLDINEALMGRIIDRAAMAGMMLPPAEGIGGPGMGGPGAMGPGVAGMEPPVGDEPEDLPAPPEDVEAAEQEMGMAPGEEGIIPGMEGMAGRPVRQDMSPAELTPEDLMELSRAIEYPTFDVEVKVGPSVPYSQALLYEQAKEFYQLGIIDRRAVLETTNFPNKDEILARIEGAEAAAMEGGGEEVGERTFGEPGSVFPHRMRGTGTGRTPGGEVT